MPPSQLLPCHPLTGVQVNNNLQAVGYAGVACAYIRDLVSLLPKPIPSPPPPPPPSPPPKAGTVVKGLSYRVFYTGWRFNTFPITPTA